MTEIVAVQALRALAALMVAFGHAQEDAVRQAAALGLVYAPSHPVPWRAGVDLFFVISGFIMVHASRPLFGGPGAARAFMARRIARIVPLYWLFSTLGLGLTVVAASVSARWPVPDAALVIAGYLFVPVDTFGDGIPRPFNLLGWTLNYEMFFYAVFALMIGAPPALAVIRVAAILGLAVAVGAAVEPGNAALFFWTRPIVLEFVIGMALALAASRVSLSRPWRAGLAGLGLAAWALDPLGSAARDLDWITPNDFARVLAWGVPAALLVAAATLSEVQPRRTETGPVMRAAAALGDASYALYLSHPFAIVALRKAWLAVGLGATLGLWPLVVGATALAVALAFAVHRWVELPLTAYARSRLEPRRKSPAPLPA